MHASNAGRKSSLAEWHHDCNRYTRKSSQDSTVSCEEVLAGNFSFKRLHDYVPSTDDIEGFAKVRILDSYSLSSGKYACKATSDGLHYEGLELLSLRVIAQGVFDAFDEVVIQRENVSSSVLHAGWILDEDSSFLLAESRKINHISPLEDLFPRAFRSRHIACIGDENTVNLHHQLVT